MDAIIFANRHGKETAPLNEYYCPAMLPIGNKATLDYTLEDLANCGINNIKLIISSDPDTIESHVENGAKWGLNIDYFLSQPQEDAKSILKRLVIDTKEPVLLIRGDMLRSPCVETFINYSQQMPNEFVQAKMSDKNAGLLLLPSEKHLLDKIDWPLSFNDEASLNDNISPTVDIVTQVLHGNCYMLDNFKSIMQANMDLANLAIPSLKPIGRKYNTSQTSKGIYLGAKTDIGLLRIQNMNGIIGQSTKIDATVELQGTNIIGNNCLIGHDSHIENSLIFPHTYVGEGLEVKHAILCHDLLISMKTSACIRLNDPVLISHNSEASDHTETVLSTRLFALLLFIITACLSPIFMAFALFCSPNQPIRKNTLIDNEGVELNSWQWNLTSPLFSRLPQLIHVISGKLDLFGYAPQLNLESYQQTTLEGARYGLYGPVQLFLSKEAPEEEKFLIEQAFIHEKGKKKYFSLIWSSMMNTPQIN
ncbi:NDP-sugar synthase [uncultured Shewanella sp.]|uniref:NDP-sugar synthase n=1 Tax=uncultured Shewanella sp. TaxID=173975 RepID=UPI002621379F|nr:NDP-sugar synthase [uncultured Shewanella sp.]